MFLFSNTWYTKYQVTSWQYIYEYLYEIGRCFIQPWTIVAMSTIWLFLALLGCVCCTDYIFSHSKLQNVAYSKKVTMSSIHVSNKFPASNVVNGILSDFAHTSIERYPWLRINLGARYRIHEIEIFARSKCCGKLF